jgi:hypothetical protein
MTVDREAPMLLPPDLRALPAHSGSTTRRRFASGAVR